MSIRASTCARVVAAVIALLLSGAPRLVAARSPDRSHGCACRHGANRCQCCSRGPLAGKKQAPPCHRSGGKNRRQPSSVGACLGSCGDDVPEARVQQQSGTDLFTIPGGGQGSASARADTLSLPRQEQHEHAQEPDTPPPRLG